MMIFPDSRTLRPLALALCLLVTGQVFGDNAEVNDKGKGKGRADKPQENGGIRDKGETARLEVWESLSDEQRDKLKQALRDVWTDPAVISAREEVKQAGDAYQESITAAVSRVDPSVAEVMTRIQRSNSGMAHEHIWGRPPLAIGQGGKGVLPPLHAPGPQEKGGSGSQEKGGSGPRRGFDDQIKPPGFLDNLPPEARDKFRRAEAAALDSEVVKAARSELEKIREEDEVLRRKRLEAHRKLRKITIDEMERIDPSIAEIRKKLPGEDRKDGSKPEGTREDEPRAEPKPEAAVAVPDAAKPK
jgi:hypothetical protein